MLVLNLNNRYLGMVKQWQDMLYSGRHSQSYMESLPDFARVAKPTAMWEFVLATRRSWKRS